MLKNFTKRGVILHSLRKNLWLIVSVFCTFILFYRFLTSSIFLSIFWNPNQIHYTILRPVETWGKGGLWGLHTPLPPIFVIFSKLKKK